MFTPNDIETRLHVRPFVPFRIVMSSGQAFDVYHPDLVLIGRRDLVVGTASTENPKHYEQTTRLALMHVTALEELLVPTLPPSNGQP
jgi:hypothetical protein